jgi:Cys-rich repeat protein
VADPACDGDRCPPAKRASCRADCEHLDEDGCAARPDCRGVYGSACDAAGNCTPDRAFRCERVESCQPVACRIHCENGYRRDPATGCELCECNPPEPSGCRADADCADGEVCLLTTTSCTPGTRCPAVTAGVCAPKGSCLSDADCADGEGCVFLMWDCAPGSDCWQGSWGTCDGSAPACRTDADCGRGEYCDAVRGCQPEPVSCTRDSECRVGQVCRIFCGTPPVSGVCIDAICAEDADCTMGEVCRPDPRDPCNRGELACFAPGVSVCLPQCGWLDEKGCVARADCRATYGLSAAGTWDFLACE